MNFLKLVALGVTLLIANIANAAIINQWSVSDAAGNCSGGPHGLWTNDLKLGGGNCQNYYSFQAGSLLTQFDDGFASLQATAENPAGVSATIDISFSLLKDYTFGGTIKGAGLGDETTWDFYTLASGTIKLNSDTYSLWDDGLASNTALQIGLGANDKSTAFGASSWLNIANPDGSHRKHWDLNMELTAVPEPSIIALMGLGLVGLGFARHRRLRQS